MEERFFFFFFYRAHTSRPYDRKTSMFIFLVTSHDGLSVVVSGERFLASDVTSRTANDEVARCSLSCLLQRHDKNFLLFNHLI